MPTFSYKARNGSGEMVSGTLVADTASVAARMLDDQALLPVEVEELASQQRSFWTGRTRRLSISKVGVMYEQLSDLLKAGVPLLRALSVLAKQASTPALVHVLREVHDDVAGGDAFADAMAKHPQAFPKLHASMVRAGEKGGFLEDVLSRLSNFVTRQDALRNKFVGSMIYPCVLLAFGLSAVSLLMVFIVPKIRMLLEEQDLPWPSLVVFAISDTLKLHFLEVLGVVLVVAVVLIGVLQSEAGQQLKARLQLRAWGFGRVYTMVALCRFCRIFGTLLANGIQILQALQIAKDATGNVILGESIDKAAENIRHGEPLAGPLAASKVFPPAIIDMIAVAEESNTLEKVLIEIADTQEERTARQIDLLMRLLEPLMLLFLGLMVLFVAVALLLPILKMATSSLK
ncbi:MAG: type II secretion system F family protein [Planctomycetes bacterium]|nr:type II secretion system F family protein [Planctomycetota bacterium]